MSIVNKKKHIAEEAPDVETLELPVLPLNEVVLFPYTLSPLVIDGDAVIKMVSKAAEGERLIALFPEIGAAEEDGDQAEGGDAKKPPAPAAPKDAKAAKVAKDAKELSFDPILSFDTVEVAGKQFTRTGVLGRIVKILKFPDNTVRILVRGLKRVKFLKTVKKRPHVTASVEVIPELKDESLECVAMARNAQTQFQEIISASPNFPEELKVAILNVEDNSRLVDLIADTLNISFKEKLSILTASSLQERFQILTILLNREIEVLHIGSAIQSQVSDALSQSQRDFFLREQLKTIRQELGEDSSSPDIAGLRARLAAAKLPDYAKKVAEKEIERLEIIPPAASEYHVSFNYIDWILSMPWNKFTADRKDIAKAKKVLDADHYGLKDVKERILEFLAVLQLKEDNKSPILCFVGPPGVGKTSLGKSIAKSLGRQFVRVSLGGIRDEAEIRGHRRTYVGALPGRVVQGIKKAGSSNPVFMLDEVDKLGNDFRGDPAAALLEVLDPEQNNSFNDHYLELDYDLSSVLFIATANLVDTIPAPLLDRMEIIRLPGYTSMEKREIAKSFLIPRQLKENGIKRGRLGLPAATIDELITYYTMEGGVRSLERCFGSLCRKVARKIVEGTVDPAAKTVIAADEVAGYLGPRKYLLEESERAPEVGLAIGMAWTGAGGCVLPVEATMMPGKGSLTLTGSLGDVMKESAQAAFSYVRSNQAQYHLAKDVFAKNDFHIHVPDGATPKDGPSAGITMVTALVSLLTGRPVRAAIAMTGEITLRGRVTPVGGIKEKVIAALRSGVREIIMPKRNEMDLMEIPDEVKKKLTFHFADRAEQALELVLLPVPVPEPVVAVALKAKKARRPSHA